MTTTDPSAIETVDLVKGALPEDCCHIEAQIQRALGRAAIPYREAIVRYSRTRYGTKPVRFGVVVASSDMARSAPILEQHWRNCSRAQKAAATRKANDTARAVADEAAEAVRRAAQAVRDEELSATFDLRWNAASEQQRLADATEYMWQLNRVAKGNESRRYAIYSLKDRLIVHLINSGYLMARGTHLEHRNGQECWGCYGAGCNRCDDTGWYHMPLTVTYQVVRFVVAGRTYTWHTLGSLPATPNVEDLGTSPMRTGDAAVDLSATEIKLYLAWVERVVGSTRVAEVAAQEPQHDHA